MSILTIHLYLCDLLTGYVFIYLCVHLFIFHLSMCSSIYVFIYLCAYLSIWLIWLSVYMTNMTICLCDSLSVCPVYLSIHPPIYLFTWDFLVGIVVFLLISFVNTPPRVSLHIYLCICLWIYLCICLSIYLPEIS